MNQEKSCISCHKTKSLIVCECCQVDVCKYCAHIMPEDSFSFLVKIPKELSHRIYCHSCYLVHVEEALQNYEEKLNQAKDIQVFLSNQGKETRLVKRLERPIKVENCLDRNETMLRLAFQAVSLGYNTLVDVNITGKKQVDGKYQKQVFSGSAIPVNKN